MSFVYPYFLWGLLAVLVPIIIHLFHFRRFKKTYFSNVSLLQYLESKNRNQNKLREILVLIARVLAVICLVLAFAQPYRIKNDELIVNQGVNYVSIFLDNSFSMNTQSEDGSLLEQAKQQALKTVGSYKTSDRFHLITQDFSSDYQRFHSQEEVLDRIQNVEIQPYSHSYSEVLARQEKVLSTANSSNLSAFAFSDFQKTAFDFAGLELHDGIKNYLSLFSSESFNNLSIDSIYIDQPILKVGNSVDFHIFITNHGEQQIQDVPVKLTLDGKVVSVGAVSLEGKQTKSIDWSVQLKNAGTLQGFVEIVDYPINFDDKFYFTLNVLEQLPVLSISQNQLNKNVKNLLSANSDILLSEMSIAKLDYAALNDNIFLILNELEHIPSALRLEVKKALERGVSVLFIPSQSFDVTSINSLINNILKSDLDSINKVDIEVSDILSSHPIFSTAFTKVPDRLLLPKIRQYYPLKSHSRSNFVRLMTLNNGDPFLTYTNYGQGVFYFLSVPLDDEYTDFQNQPVFVVSLLNMIFQSSVKQNIAVELSEQNHSEIRLDRPYENSDVYILKSTTSDFEMIPMIKYQGNSLLLNTMGNLTEAGNYVLTTGGKAVSGVSYNFNRQESGLDAYSLSELDSEITKNKLENFRILKTDYKSLSNSDLKVNTGWELWKILLLLTLIFLLTEILFLKKK